MGTGTVTKQIMINCLDRGNEVLYTKDFHNFHFYTF